MARKYAKKEEKINFITPEGLASLKQEYEDRKGKLREEIASRIDEARRFGDLSENSAYTAAMEEKDFNEARIAALEELIQTSQVVKDTNTGKITLGSTVHLRSEKGITTYKVVGAEESDPTRQLISDQSPLGQSLLGKQKGDKIKVKIPSGSLEFVIESID